MKVKATAIRHGKIFPEWFVGCGDKIRKAVNRTQSKIADEKTSLCDHRTAQLFQPKIPGHKS